LSSHRLSSIDIQVNAESISQTRVRNNVCIKIDAPEAYQMERGRYGAFTVRRQLENWLIFPNPWHIRISIDG